VVHAEMIPNQLDEGFCPERWRHAIDITLEKIPGVPIINKLRLIQLMEADLNQFLGSAFVINISKLARETPGIIIKHQGDRNQRDNLCLQKDYCDVWCMSATKLARSMKEFIIAGRKFEENFCIFPLYRNEEPISRPHDVPNKKDAITVYYLHFIAGNNVSGKMRIQSTSTIAQMKHAMSTFKQYLIKDQVHINNAQLGPEEAVVLGWIPGFHPELSFPDNMCETIKDQMPIEYANIEWALFPKTIYYTRASDGVELSTLGVSLQVIKQSAGQVNSTCEDIAKNGKKFHLSREVP
jgi:hypothetical protein